MLPIIPPYHIFIPITPQLTSSSPLYPIITSSFPLHPRLTSSSPLYPSSHLPPHYTPTSHLPPHYTPPHIFLPIIPPSHILLSIIPHITSSSPFHPHVTSSSLLHPHLTSSFPLYPHITSSSQLHPTSHLPPHYTPISHLPPHSIPISHLPPHSIPISLPICLPLQPLLSPSHQSLPPFITLSHHHIFLISPLPLSYNYQFILFVALLSCLSLKLINTLLKPLFLFIRPSLCMLVTLPPFLFYKHVSFPPLFSLSTYISSDSLPFFSPYLIPSSSLPLFPYPPLHLSLSLSHLNSSSLLSSQLSSSSGHLCVSPSFFHPPLLMPVYPLPLLPSLITFPHFSILIYLSLPIPLWFTSFPKASLSVPTSFYWSDTHSKGLTISYKVLWHSPDSNFTGNAQDIYSYMSLRMTIKDCRCISQGPMS